ncbi:phosphatase PAP2 family protein [Mucilaginibacter sp. BJC16-A38]|uniref:phosphatase PAP2 family protein n=1 Tax=Mucilaginibacter phenanthrenivorans TaxID=1234842 RepID=UPI0021581294|nr:phosphatase PAP2 family protein [Mucilaginibacter phenanthrenivorans]MCR8558271.1 phosphatase PAP2 family protein [Mucilaginibacter phenanthrenivorans]
MKKLVIVLLCIISFRAGAQVTDTTIKKLGDTIKKDLTTAPDTVQHLHSKTAALIFPAALVGYGIASFVFHPVRRFDYYVNSGFNKYYPHSSGSIESYFQFAPVAMVYGLNLVGVEGKNRFIDRTALLGLSAAFAGGSVYILKNTTHRLRPNNANKLSFPSGHTANAFMGAEFLAQEYSGKSPVYGIVAYSFAITTGVFRMYHRDHWFSDVVAGAGFGILSTKAAYLVYPYVRNAFSHTSKAGKHTMVMPMYQDGVKGMSFAMEL